MTVRTFLDGRVSLHCGDCREVMASLPEASVDSIVTDPPYGLEFMGKEWDSFTGAGMAKPGIGDRETAWPSFTGTNKTRCRSCGQLVGQGGSKCKCENPQPYSVALPRLHGFQSFMQDVFTEAFRVLKPGGHLLAFSGTRTYHRLACAIEDAGFEIRDQIGWAYGCLDEQTVAVTPSGNVHHSALKAGDLVLTYDVDRGSYQWGAVEHVHRYRISDTVYRVSTDHGEQVVSRNHRCIVERGGVESFALAEEVARQRQASVPVLESLPELLEALPRVHEGTGDAESGLLDRLQSGADRGEGGRPTITVQSTSDGHVCGVRQGESDPTGVAAQGRDANVLAGMQRRLARGRVENARAQGARGMDAGIGSRLGGAVYGAVQSLVEGWRHIPAQARQLCERALCPVPAGVPGDVATGWLRHGTSLSGRAHHRALPDTSGVGAPHRPQAAQQLPDEPHAVRDEQRSQAVRAWPGHKTVVGRVTPEHYDGVIWCVTVRTGAFVAVRNGMAFPTGNSGFPKSLDVSKAIDKAAGAEREVTGVVDTRSTFDGRERASAAINVNWREAEGRSDLRDLSKKVLSEPATDSAREWQGWGTALKPAWEPICVARKPLIGTVAENVLRHGTGALNIDGCRIEATARPARELDAKPTQSNVYVGRTGEGGLGKGLDGGSKAVGTTDLGRWPANLIHDGSDEVMACFPDAPGQQGDVKGTETSGVTADIYGKFNGRVPAKARRDGEASADRRYTESGGTNFAALPGMRRSDGASAARFFYTAKADSSDRIGSKHPTVKPIDLMQYLVRLVTPKGGVCLDPFAGSGTTGEAAWREGMSAILIEREAEYQEDIARRMDLAVKPSKRAAVAKTKGKIDQTGDLPLFAGDGS